MLILMNTHECESSFFFFFTAVLMDHASVSDHPSSWFDQFLLLVLDSFSYVLCITLKSIYYISTMMN